MKNKKFIFCFFLFALKIYSQDFAILKYEGGGDWYSNPTSINNLILFCNNQINTKISPDVKVVEPDDPEIFEYPIVFMTGHGNVIFSNKSIKNLRTYLLGGGFLHIDDNYGMKPYILPQLKKLFPNKELKELPINHLVFNIYFKFPKGLPKIHEHDGLAPKAMGIFHKKELILLYTYESDLSDGWEDPEIHNDPKHIREKALKMGANIIKYVFEKSK